MSSGKYVRFGSLVSPDQLRTSGFEVDVSADTRVRVGNAFEGPCSIKTSLMDIERFGAFSYINGRGRFTGVRIGRYCSIAESVSVGYPEHPLNWMSTSVLQYQRPAWSASVGKWGTKAHSASKKTSIGNDVWIGAGVFIRSGVSIGTGSVIGAHSVVTKDVEPYSVVAGNPARHIRYRLDLGIAKDLMSLAWWNFSPAQLDGCDFSDPKAAVLYLERKREMAEPEYSALELFVTGEGAALTGEQKI